MRTSFYLPFIIYLVPGFGNAFFFRSMQPTIIWLQRNQPNILNKDDDLVSNSKLNEEEALSKTKARNGVPYENSVRNNKINESEKSQFILMQEGLKDGNREVTAKHEAFPLKETQFSPFYYMDPFNLNLTVHHDKPPTISGVVHLSRSGLYPANSSILSVIKALEKINVENKNVEQKNLKQEFNFNLLENNTVPEAGIHPKDTDGNPKPNSEEDSESVVFAEKTPYQDVEDKSFKEGKSFEKLILEKIDEIHKSFFDKEDEENSKRAVNKLRGTVDIKSKSETDTDTANKKDDRLENEVNNTPESQIDGEVTINMVDGNVLIKTPGAIYMENNTKQNNSTQNPNSTTINDMKLVNSIIAKLVAKTDEIIKPSGYSLTFLNDALDEKD